MKYSIGLALVGLIFWSCVQSNTVTEKSDNVSEQSDTITIRGLAISSSIKADAETHFATAGEYENINTSNAGFQLFENSLEFEFYEGDSLIVSTQGTPRPMLFKSFYIWQGDTLTIDGAIGLFGGGGFSIKIINGKATVYHMLSSDDFPAYAYGEKTKLIYRLEVPCHNTKAIISEIPTKGSGKIIYGYVEFKSDDYYTSQGTSEDGEEYKARKKSRSNMKMYFKSGELKI